MLLFILDHSNDSDDDYQHMIRTKQVYKMKKSLVLLFSLNYTPKFLEDDIIIKKKYINMVEFYWFGFISSTIIPSQN